jgi:lipoate-protein ligase A
MAVDEALLLSVARGDAAPTLRLYGWRPPGVSLGHFQEIEGQIDVQECARRGYTIVRRPTGGRAILHDDEVTYSVAVRQADLAGGERLIESYREISRGIEEGLRRIGVEAGMAQEKIQGSGSLPAACFAKAARSDMTVDGRKIVGSAQARRYGAILQHGSIPLRVHVANVAAVMAPDRRARKVLGEAAVSVSDAAGRDVSFEEMCEALEAGFQEGLGVSLAEGELTGEERRMVEWLRERKYASEEWNLARQERAQMEGGRRQSPSPTEKAKADSGE